MESFEHNKGQKLLAKKVSRRDFIKTGVVGATVLGSTQTASADGGSKCKRLAMVIDLQRCTGCGGCVLSCKSENNVQRGNAWASRKIKTVGKFPNVRFEFIPTLCNHCENAPCVKGCPTGAMHKGYGNITMHTPEKCIGCKTCMAMCPYNVIFRHYEKPHPHWRNNEALIDGCTSSPKELTQKSNGNVIPYYNDAKEKSTNGSGLRYKGIVEKCTLCDHRVKNGLLPHCVLSCPADARVMGDLDDPNSPASKLLAKYRPWRLKEHLGTEPKVFYIRNFNPGASKRTKGKV
ncbi:MAG: 4Fe-4S dicluster domain-containing protein [Planctomycetota bacterium]|jgi:molybdopterin-containing oxidoreductase family iron-sulfur binding subunit